MSARDNITLKFTRRNKKQEEKQKADIQQDLEIENVLFIICYNLSI